MSNKPTHNLCLAIGEAKNTRWHRVAGLWQTKDCSPACKFDPFVGVIGVEK